MKPRNACLSNLEGSPMKHLRVLAAFALAAATCLAPLAAHAQLPVLAATDQAALLKSADPQLAANKKLVYDFWREVFEAGHMESADRYMAESYIQHNPNVPTGRAAFVAFFTQFVKPKAIQPTIQAPVVTLVAEGDRVVISFVRTLVDPKDATKKSTTTWFDMFRIENGKLAEHWDCAPKE
jgi:predicted SnoaL-like aldol condensation-catalyzing enzyme